MKITFYAYEGQPNVINKSLPEGTTVEAYSTDSFDIDSPQLRLTNFDLSYNYCYIEETKRYYFIDGVTIDPNQIFIVDLSIDVLMTFKDALNESFVHVTEGIADDFDISQTTDETPMTLFDTIKLNNIFDYDNKSILLIALNTGTSNTGS